MLVWYIFCQGVDLDYFIMCWFEMGIVKDDMFDFMEVEILEEIGQSIVRYFWDGGVIVLSVIVVMVIVFVNKLKYGFCVRYVYEVFL